MREMIEVDAAELEAQEHALRRRLVQAEAENAQLKERLADYESDMARAEELLRSIAETGDLGPMLTREIDAFLGDATASEVKA